MTTIRLSGVDGVHYSKTKAAGEKKKKKREGTRSGPAGALLNTAKSRNQTTFTQILQAYMKSSKELTSFPYHTPSQRQYTAYRRKWDIVVQEDDKKVKNAGCVHSRGCRVRGSGGLFQRITRHNALQLLTSSHSLCSHLSCAKLEVVDKIEKKKITTRFSITASGHRQSRVDAMKTKTNKPNKRKYVQGVIHRKEDISSKNCLLTKRRLERRRGSLLSRRARGEGGGGLQNATVRTIFKGNTLDQQLICGGGCIWLLP